MEGSRPSYVGARPSPRTTAVRRAAARARRRHPRDGGERGLRHRRPPLHGNLAGVPYPIIPGHVSVGRVLETAGRSSTSKGGRSSPGRSSPSTTSSASAASAGMPGGQGRRRAARTAGSTASRARADEGLLGGWAEQIEMLPGVRVCRFPRASRRGLHGRRLRPAHGLPRGGAGRHRPRRHRGRAGERAGRPERRDLRPARGRLRVLVVGAPKARLEAARAWAPRTPGHARGRATRLRASAGCATGRGAAAPTW